MPSDELVLSFVKFVFLKYCLVLDFIARFDGLEEDTSFSVSDIISDIIFLSVSTWYYMSMG